MNYTTGPNRILPLLLAFGVLSRFRTPSEISTNQRDRIEALKLATTEMEAILAELGISRALQLKLQRVA